MAEALDSKSRRLTCFAQPVHTRMEVKPARMHAWHLKLGIPQAQAQAWAWASAGGGVGFYAWKYFSSGCCRGGGCWIFGFACEDAAAAETCAAEAAGAHEGPS